VSRVSKRQRENHAALRVFLRLTLARAAHDGVRDIPKGQCEIFVRALQVRVRALQVRECFVLEFFKFSFPLLVYVRLVLGRRGLVLDRRVVLGRRRRVVSALRGNCSGVGCWSSESGEYLLGGGGVGVGEGSAHSSDKRRGVTSYHNCACRSGFAGGSAQQHLVHLLLGAKGVRLRAVERVRISGGLL